MRKFFAIAACAVLLPMAANASTVVVQGGGPYDVQSDNLFFGVANSTGGAGSYTVDFFNSSGSVTAVADVAVTTAAIQTLFTGLTITWLDGLTLNTLVQSPGIDTLTTTFTSLFPTQKLQFSWSNSVAGAGFGFDVETSEVPIPAALPLFVSALFGLFFASPRRRKGLQPTSA